MRDVGSDVGSGWSESGCSSYSFETEPPPSVGIVTAQIGILSAPKKDLRLLKRQLEDSASATPLNDQEMTVATVDNSSQTSSLNLTLLFNPFNNKVKVIYSGDIGSIDD
jgi:hypothetical protein